MKKSPLLSGILLCSMISCYHEDEYLPTNINADGIIKQLSATATSIPADGQSFTYILAELPIEALDARSNVTFTTTKGTFDNNSKTITMAATVINDAGTNKRIAKVKLVSSTVIESADVTATVSNVSNTISISFTNLAFDSYLTVTAVSNTIPADGASYTYINVDQPIDIINDYGTITFTTTTGQFDNGTKTITKASSIILANGIYKRTLQVRITSSKTVEVASVEIAIKGTSKTLSISFIKAFPENIKLSVGSPFVLQGYANSIQITLNLIRTTGIPSINNEAGMKVTDTNNMVRGTFVNYNTKSDANGIITNKFTLGNDSYKGILIITASGTDDSGKALADTTQIISQ